MKNLRSLTLVFAGLASFATCVPAQTNKPVKKTASHLSTAIGGKTLYGQFCAVCHGVDGKGAGPVAAALKQSPTDLTQMSRQNHGTFPEERFIKMMNGELPTSAHGTPEMPIWGSDFRKTTNNPNIVQDRIHALLNYVEELQAK